MAEPTITLRIAFASDPFAAVPSWNDISSDGMDFSITKGRQHELDRMEAGIATLTLLNTSGNYWANNAGGAYYPNIKPLKRVNIRATYGATTYDLYTGFVESWDPDFILRPIKGPIMRLPCVDLISNLSRLLLNNAGYAEELSGTRIGNVLDDLGWAAGDRDLDAGLTTIRASGVMENENATEHLFLVQQSENGIVFIQGDGDVEFQDRGARLRVPYTTSQGTFGDGAGELGYNAIEFADDVQYLYNDIHITREGGTEQTASDAASQTAYGKRSFQRTGLLFLNDNEAQSYAEYLLSRYKDPALRLKSITIRPGADPDNLYPLVLGLDISSRITIKLSQANIDEDYHIEGIRHTWDARSKIWETRWELTPVSQWIYWALGIAGISELGLTTRLFY